MSNGSFNSDGDGNNKKGDLLNEKLKDLSAYLSRSRMERNVSRKERIESDDSLPDLLLLDISNCVTVSELSSFLALQLFQPVVAMGAANNNDDMKLCNALDIIQYLVSVNSSKYLIPLSFAIQDASKKMVQQQQQQQINKGLINEDNNHDYFSPTDELLNILVSQISPSNNNKNNNNNNPVNSSNCIKVSECAHNTIISIAIYCKNIKKTQNNGDNISVLYRMGIQVVQAIVHQWKSYIMSIKQNNGARTDTSTVRIRFANTMTCLACIFMEKEHVTVLPENSKEVTDLFESAMNMLLIDGVFSNDDNSSDVLLQISVLDLVYNNMLARNTTAVAAQSKNWVVDWLSTNFATLLYNQFLKNGDNDIITNDAMRTYVNIGIVCKRCYSSEQNGKENHKLVSNFESIFFGSGKNNGLVHKFVQDHSTTGEVDRLVIIDIVSSLAKTNHNWQKYICDDEVLSHGWLCMSNATQTQLKSSILHSMAQVLSLEIGNHTNNHDAAIRILDTFDEVNNHNSYHQSSIHGALDLFIQKFVKSPFHEIRLATFEILRIIATIQGRLLLLHGECLEYLLLASSTETTKIGKEAKYEIIKALVTTSKNKQAMDILLSDQLIQKFEDIVVKGPHFVSVIPWELATE